MRRQAGSIRPGKRFTGFYDKTMAGKMANTAVSRKLPLTVENHGQVKKVKKRGWKNGLTE